MTNRYPLIVDTFDSNKIKELPSGDNLNLTGSDIVGVENVTASGAISAGSITIDSITINGAEVQSIATSGDYNDLINKPTGLSAFTNDANFITTGSNISSLNNDSNFISSVNWPQINNKPTTIAGFGIVDALSVGANISTLVNDSGYLKASDLQNGVITVDVNNTGDLKGSVFGDDSTPLVDSVLSAINLNNTIRGDVIPVQDSQWDLGSSSQKFADAHLSGTVTANAFVGDGSGLTGITSSGVLQTAGNIGLGSVDLAVDTFTVLGTTGQINVEASAFALSFSLAPVISNDLKGSVFADDSTLLVDGVNGSIPASVIDGTIAQPHTKFIFTQSQPPNTPNSEYIGKAVGTWYECTFANAANTFGLSPDSADRDPTLTGITFNVDRFSGFEQNSTYEFHISPELYERTTTEGIRIHGWDVSTGAFSSMSVYSPGTGSFNVNGLSCNDHIIVTFEDADPANNWIRYSLDSDQGASYWIGQAIMHIKKIG